jgi:hypothetical protein
MPIRPRPPVVSFLSVHRPHSLRFQSIPDARRASIDAFQQLPPDDAFRRPTNSLNALNATGGGGGDVRRRRSVRGQPRGQARRGRVRREQGRRPPEGVVDRRQVRRARGEERRIREEERRPTFRVRRRVRLVSGAISFTLVPIRPRWRGERRSLRTFAGASLRPRLAFDPRCRRLSTPPDAFLSTPPRRSLGYGSFQRPSNVTCGDYPVVDEFAFSDEDEI